jgi:hypothetical protein
MAGTDKCGCIVIPYGYILADSLANPTEQIPVFITDISMETQMSSIMANIKTGYDALYDADKITMANKIIKMLIITTTSTCEQVGNQYIIKFSIEDGLNATAIKNLMEEWVNIGPISQTKQPARNSVELAMTPQSKAHALSADFGKRKN